VSDDQKPEADALEQSRSVVDDEDDVLRLSDDPEAPETDVMEQHREVVSRDRATHTRHDVEVPDADAAEQDLSVVDDDDGRAE